MKTLYSFILCFVVTMTLAHGQTSMKSADNQELAAMVKLDQEMRVQGLETGEQDEVHRKRVMEILADGLVITPNDKFNAALILQHTSLTYCDDKLTSKSVENYYLAYCLVKSEFDKGHREFGPMVAATYDRYLLYTVGYQKFGTQKIYDEATDQFVLAPMDPNTSDEERAAMGIYSN